jgi:hypothetical protein
MSKEAMESALTSIFNSPFVVANYAGQAAPTTLTTYGPPANAVSTTTSGTSAAKTPVSLVLNTSGGIGGSISMLQANGVDTSGMSEAQIISALQNIYPPAILETFRYPSTTTSTTGGTTNPTTNTTAPTGGTTLANTTANTPGLGSTGIGINLTTNPLTTFGPPASSAPPVSSIEFAGAVNLLKQRGYNTAGMSQAAMESALASLFNAPYKINNYVATTSGGTTGTTTSPTTLTTFGPPPSLAPSPTTVVPSNVNQFMTSGVNFPPRTQFNQTASAPLNISQQGNIYGAPAPVYSTLPVTPPPTQFKSVQPGGAVGAVPAFQNPFTAPATSFTSNNTIGADIARNALLSRGFTQANVAGMNANQLATEMGKFNPGESFKIVNFADGGLTSTNNMNGMTGMVPQFQNPFGPQQPQQSQQSQQPQQPQQPQQHQSISVGGTPQQPGLPGLLSVGSQNPYPQGYTPIGQQPQNFLSLN